MDTGSSRCRILMLLLAPPVAPLLKNALDHSASLHHAEQQDGRDAMLRVFFFSSSEQEACNSDGSLFCIVAPRLLLKLQSFVCINIKPVACCMLS